MKRIITIITFISVLGFNTVSAQSLPDFTDLIEKNSPAVVNISTTMKQQVSSRQQFNMPDIPEDSPFFEFFERFFNQNPENQEPFQERSSLGSGFIISRDGYVITNNHVISGAEEIIVRLNDRREFVAEVVGADPRSDIAVIKIDGNNLPVLELGDSSKLKVGEWVLAIGSPFGFDYSVTQGIVSAMGRALPSESYVPFIQTDVAINPGNSGGPLFNLEGEVVGVNSQIFSRSGGYMGLSFAVPINVVTDVYEQILEKGSVSRGWLGVIIQDVTRELAESFGMDVPRGALVARVLPDTPAERSDLEVGDVIIEFDRHDVIKSSDLPPIVGSTRTGTKVPVKVIRSGRERTVMVTVEELPENMTADNKDSTRDRKPEAASNALKIVVSDATEEEKELYEIEDHGVVVQSVNEGPARDAGIREGDVILMLDNKEVANVSEFNRMLAELPRNKSIPILIQRRGNPTFLAFKLGDE